MTTSISEKPRYLIIGAGMAGILSAIKLKENGNTNFAVYEKASTLGGTWRENTYPGIACDVPSHLYSYSFAPNPDWTHVFSPGHEIFQYFKDVAQRHDVESFINYNSEVESLELINGKWHLKTKNGLSDEGDFVIAATGVLHHPNYPDIPGQESFKGKIFHSARWDHSVELSNKRVGVIGTGSSAVQIVSDIVGKVKDLYLFQRTPQWILKVENPEIPEEQRKEYRENPALLKEVRERYSRAFSDYFANAVVDSKSEQLEMLQKMCIENLEQNVKDKELRERLRPDYRAGCKRLVVSSNFYEAISSPNAHLVTEKIISIEPEGIAVADGSLYELDVIVLATGFRVNQFIRPIRVKGLNGVDLDQYWGAIPTAYMAIAVPGFPNLFLLNGPNGPVGNFSLIEVAEIQWDYIQQLIDELKETGNNLVVAKQSALDKFEQDRIEAVQNTVWVTGCRSWYLDQRGIPAVWPWSFDRFREVMAKPDFGAYEMLRV